MGLDRREFLGGVVALALGPRRVLFQDGGNPGMYGLIGSMHAAADRRDELVRILLQGTSGMPGCLSYVVATDPVDPAAIWITEVWESREAHEASLSLPAVREAISRGRPLIAGFGQRTVTAPVGGHGLGQPGTAGHARDAVAPVDDRIVLASALLHVQPAEAFAYFAEDRLLTSWLARESNVEPRVGGPYELFWDPADRQHDSTIGCRVTALAAPQLLAFQWRSPRQFKAFANTADPLTHVVVLFVAEGEGTRVRLVHSGWRSGAEWESARAWQDRAWTTAFAQLEAVSRRDR